MEALFIVFYCARSGQKKNLLQFWLSASLRVHLHDHYIFHVFIPFVHNRAVRLIFFSKGHAFLTFEITKQLIADIPDRVVADASLFEYLFHLRPYMRMPVLVFFQFSFFYRCFPYQVVEYEVQICKEPDNMEQSLLRSIVES